MFKKFEVSKYPRRLWAVVGHPGAGKSTFGAQMRTPILPIDADGRFSEVVNLVKGDVYQLSDNPADSVDPATIYRLLEQSMPGSGVKTIEVDSLTAILTPKVVQAVMESAARRERNRAKKAEGKKDLENLTTPFIDKALAMRLLQDGVSRWQVDVLWIYHLMDGLDQNANEVTRPILSKTERARLYRSLNLELHVVIEGQRRGIKVVWARRGRSGMTLWDDTGTWAGMPEKIEAAVYDGLSEADQERNEGQTPASFASPEQAIAWGFEQGAFGTSIEHARNAYDKLKRELQPKKATDMWRVWIGDVKRRLAESEPVEPVEEIEF
jgi:hypothetical protein